MTRLSRRMEAALALRLGLVIALGAVFALLWAQPGLAAARILAGLALAGACAWLWWFLGRTNRALARFVDAIRFEDFSQRFTLGDGGGFDELGQALDTAMTTLAARRADATQEGRLLAAIVDGAPVPLLMLGSGDRLTLLNKAARRQFGSLHPARLSDLESLGAEFVAALALPPAGRRLTRMMQGGVLQRAIIEAAEIERLGEELKIVSVLPVQKMLGSAELAAQSDLVRVLTHEIMNSLTPVTSLARTAADLLAGARAGDAADLADARAAIDTVARRAEGLHRFVASYRAFARAPALRRQVFAAQPWAVQITQLFAADTAGGDAGIMLSVATGCEIDGDPELLAQVCLNLLRNGAHAARDTGAVPALALAIGPAAGGGTMIEVCDNGPGVPADRRADIFLPFYTTRPDGNGVGLSFVQQVIVAHGGTIAVDDAPAGGARIRAIF